MKKKIIMKSTKPKKESVNKIDKALARLIEKEKGGRKHKLPAS